ncbi:MAG: DnaD domain protein [Clostridia bacterium]|nr:DnaD domain protein [Clostridia bacterium]MDD4375247.1 DnaD domain protein [Clostridia bacterium]
MKYVEKVKIEMSDVLIPDLFISNYMVGLEEHALKIYLYIKFVSKNQIDVSAEQIAKKIGIRKVEYEKAVKQLEEEELLIKTEEGYIITDIKEQELNKTYIPKLKPKADSRKTELEKKRIAAASAINETFFQGIMTLGWYVDISTLFEKYVFDEDVMIALFQYCQERNALRKNYVFKVAETWYKGKVKTFEQLETFLENQDKLNKIKNKIKRVLRLSRNLTEYEEEHIERWINEYKYDFEIIDIALKKTVQKTTNPTLNYANAIIKSWNEKGYKTLSEILEEDGKITKQMVSKTPNKAKSNLKHKTYEQRKYDDLESYYDNI